MDIAHTDELIWNTQNKSIDLKDEMCRLRNENAELKAELSTCKDRLTSLENYMRRPNLIFDGVPESQDKTLEQNLHPAACYEGHKT